MKAPVADRQAENPSRLTEIALLLGSGLLSIILLSILVLQLRGIWLHYPYYVTTGGENLSVYGIWKVQENHPLYTWPNKDFCQLTLYNFGFYDLYAVILTCFHARGPLIMLYGRYLTVIFAICGSLIQTRLICFLTKDVANSVVLASIWLVCFCTWFNSYFSGYYPISVRPDVATVATSTLALYCFIIYATTSKLPWLFLAAVVWMEAWCLKQADIICLFGAGVYLVLSRKWSAAMALSLIFAVPVALIIGFSSEPYRWNVLVAPTANSLELFHGVELFLQGLALSLFTWTFIITLPVYLGRKLPGYMQVKFKTLLEQMRPGGDLASIMVLFVVVLAGMPLALLALSKTGSSLNQMFEVFVVATTLSFVLAVRLAYIVTPVVARRYGVIIGASLISMCVFPICQISMKRIGPIVRASDAAMVRKKDFALFIKSLKKPVFIDDDIYCLPWYSNGNQYPAIVLDHIFYNDAEKRGMISGGVGQLMAKHWFATLYLEENSMFYKDAIDANYRKQPLARKYGSYLNGLGRESRPGVLLTAPP